MVINTTEWKQKMVYGATNKACLKLVRSSFHRSSSNFVSSYEWSQSTWLIPFQATSYVEIL